MFRFHMTRMSIDFIINYLNYYYKIKGKSMAFNICKISPLNCQVKLLDIIQYTLSKVTFRSKFMMACLNVNNELQPSNNYHILYTISLLNISFYIHCTHYYTGVCVVHYTRIDFREVLGIPLQFRYRSIVLITISTNVG